MGFEDFLERGIEICHGIWYNIGQSVGKDA